MFYINIGNRTNILAKIFVFSTVRLLPLPWLPRTAIFMGPFCHKKKHDISAGPICSYRSHHYRFSSQLTALDIPSHDGPSFKKGKISAAACSVQNAESTLPRTVPDT